uniref:Cupin-like domain-containing protein n=1 Tax=Chrysotila carterae TaxID=13221 RepID=A0A7S4B0B4_CHRCT
MHKPIVASTLFQALRMGVGYCVVGSPTQIDNFPLVNVTHPDYERFPLLRDAHIMTVDVPAGSALILPALWYHQVDSFAEPGQLNVAVNYWFQGHSLATRFYRTLRENVFINCTLPAPPGQPHLCRDSVLEG